MKELFSQQNREMSKETKEKSEIAKKFIEQKYQKNFQEEKMKKEYYDKLISQMQKMSLNEQDLNVIINDLNLKHLRQKRQKESILDYQSLAIIGRGAFGEVRLCRHTTGEIVAIKKMSKREMNEKKQLNHIRAERDILVLSDARWIVELKSSFTDSKNLYLVMEYLPGGDLMNLLIEKNVFPESLARFYMAEAILAVESVHKLNYIHRDLKPDNILIGCDGHIKLTDFGLCKPYQLHVKNFDSPALGSERRPSQKLTKREKVYSMVGTVDYIAPEVFTNDGYTETVDWWSLGTILFEMLMGYPPFYGENPTATCRKVMNFEKHFEIPPEIEVSQEAIDLLYRLITRPESRLGKNGVAEIKKHAFFRGIDWEGIRDQKAPFIPKLSGKTDTSNFDKFEETTKWHEEYKQGEGVQRRRKRDYFWIGYSYKRSYNYEVEKDLKNIFENLKKKKETQKKRMFSEEKIAAFNKKSLSKKFRKEKKKFEVRQKYGFNFIKKKAQQQEIIEENKEKPDYPSKQTTQIFQSYQSSEQKNAFVKKLKKKDKKKTKLSEKKDKIFKKPSKNKMSGLRLLKQPQSSLLDSQDSKSKIRKISSKLQKPSFKHLNGVFLPKTTLKNPYSFGLKPELAVLKPNKKVLKLKQESKKLQLLNYKHVLRICLQTRRNWYPQKLHVRLSCGTRVSQKVRFRQWPKNASMSASKCESITRGNCSSKRPSMSGTSTTLLNNSSFQYNFFIMNIFAFYLALQYVKIIGDFANKPDAFDDPSILQQLEREVSDNPVEHQGFLTQVYNEQVKVADSLQFEFEKIQKQQLIQKYSEKGLIGEGNPNLGVKNQVSNSVQGVKGKQEKIKNKLQKNDQESQAEKAKIKDEGQKSINSVQKDQTEQNLVKDNKVEQNSNQQKEQVQQNNINKLETQNQKINQQNGNFQNQDQAKHLKRNFVKDKIHLHFHDKIKFHLIDQKQSNQNLSSNQKNSQPLKKEQEMKQTVSSQQSQQKETQKNIQQSLKKSTALKLQKTPNKIDLANSEQIDFTEKTKNALRKATDVVVKVIALIFIITTLIIYALMLIFGRQIVLQEINNGIANGYTEFIEKQQEVKHLQKEMKDLLKILHWRSIGSQKDDNFLLHNEQGVYNTLEYPGQRYLFNITLPINSTFTLIKIPKQDLKVKTSKKKNEPEIKPKEERSILTLEDAELYCVKKGPQFLYFEIQVDYLHDKTDFVIGFTSKKFIKEAKGDYIPGVKDVSFGFRVKTGEVLNNGNIIHTFNMLEEILDVYSMDDSKNFDFNGSFFGVGISLNTKEFFFSYNGRILNSLSFQTAGEIRFQIFNKKRKDELETDFYLHKQDKINKVAKALKLDKNYREEIKKTPIFKSKLSSYVPVIYVNGIRGYPLQLKERQIRTGLLKNGILND